jgi:hypothetical protein
MDETKGAILGFGWACILYVLVFYLWLDYGGLWFWLGAVLAGAVGAGIGYVVGKQLSE